MKYNELIAKWNPEMVLYIRYRTNYSKGLMTMSIAFFIEKYKKITRLLKRVEIREIYVKNEFTGIVIKELFTLKNAYEYAMGEIKKCD